MLSPLNDNEVEAQRQMDSYKEFIANPTFPDPLASVVNPLPPARVRLLRTGELIQAGDECQIADGSWLPVGIASYGLPKASWATYRRAVKPAAAVATTGAAAGYHYLTAGEVILKGDEWQRLDGSWVPVNGFIGSPKSEIVVRRPVAAAAATTGINPKDAVGATKPPLSLVPPCFHVYVAMAMKNGAKKYGPYNWRTEKVQSMIYLDAAMRHIQSFVDGETNAKDSGQHHLAHAAACCAILLDAFLTDSVKDNRPTPGKTAELIEQFTEKKI